MSWLTGVMAALLRCSAGLLPANRRVWADALLAEAGAVPAGRHRLAWLAGGVRLTVREAALARRLMYPLAFAAAAAAAAWSAWSGPAGDPAIVPNRVGVIALAVILAGLPWAIRRARGPAAGGRAARLVRTGGYAALFALVLVRTAVERVAYAPPNNVADSSGAWMRGGLFLAVMAGYAAGMLALTARRSRAAPATVAIGAATGAAVGVLAYALGPLGFPLRFTGPWPAGLYDAALALGVLLALAAPVAAVSVPGKAPRPGCAPGRPPRWWSPSCPPPPLRCCPTTPGSSTGPQATSVIGRRSSASGRRSSAPPASATWPATAPSRPGTSSCCWSARCLAAPSAPWPAWPPTARNLPARGRAAAARRCPDPPPPPPGSGRRPDGDHPVPGRPPPRQTRSP